MIDWATVLVAFGVFLPFVQLIPEELLDRRLPRILFGEPRRRVR
jgi:hypothetical protein